MAAKRYRRRTASQRMGGATACRLGAEALESRHMMASMADLGNDATIVSVPWEGQVVDVVRGSYVIRVPQGTGAGALTADAQASLAAPPSSGWSVRPLGSGFFEVRAGEATQDAVFSWASSVGATEMQPNMVGKLAADVPSQSLPADPYFANGLLWGERKIQAPEAWNLNVGSSDLIAAVLDEGVDYNHEDLAANMWDRTRDAKPNQPIPAQLPAGTDFVGAHGYDHADDDPEVMPQDSRRTPPLGNAGPLGIHNNQLLQVHGTAVAGIIGATANSKGVVGVAQQSRIYSAKVVSDAGYGRSTAFVYWSDVVQAIERICKLKTEYGQQFVVVNASFWFPQRSLYAGGLSARLEECGILLVAAAGNDGAGVNQYPTLGWGVGTSPTNVIVVGASDQKDLKCTYSAAGEVYAPGEEIWSTWSGYMNDGPGTARFRIPEFDRGGTGEKIWGQTPSNRYDFFTATETGRTAALGPGRRGWMEGTSMAAPHVSGTAILVATEYRQFTGRLPSPAYIKSAILNGADLVNGILRLNAYKSLCWVRENLPPSIAIQAGEALEGDTGSDEVAFRVAISNYDKNRQQKLPVTASQDIWITYELIGAGDPDGKECDAKRGVDFDYARQVREFMIPKGASSVVFTNNTRLVLANNAVRSQPLANLIGDTIKEANERFKIRLTGIRTAGDEWIASKVAYGTILNDDADGLSPAVTMRDSALTVAETSTKTGAVSYFATVRVDDGSGGPGLRPLTFKYTVRELLDARDSTGQIKLGAAKAGEDFLATSGTITVPAGQATALIPFRIMNDVKREDDERFSIVLKETGPDGLYVDDGGYPRPGVLKRGKLETEVTIKDPSPSDPSGPPVGETPTIIVTGPGPITEGTGRNTVYSFTVDMVDKLNRPFPLSVPVTVAYSFVGGDLTDTTRPAASTGSDYVAVQNGLLTLRPGQTRGVISFTVVGDQWGQKRGDRPGDLPGSVWDAQQEYLTLRINSVVNADILTARNFVVKITDDDQPLDNVPRVSVTAVASAAAAFAELGQAPSSSLKRRVGVR